MQIIEKDINDLKPYGNNPRINDDAVEKVAESIKQFGWKVPAVIDKNNIIVAGHTRLKAAQLLGITKIPCIIADDLTEEQINAFRLADNKTAEFASWDLDKLAAELAEIEDIDMASFGFEFAEEDDDEIIEDDFEEEIPEEPKSKQGEIYKLGQHRLMVGDSTSAADVQALMNGEKADMVITDPPYNVDYKAKDEFLEKYRPCKRVKAGKYSGIENDKMENSQFVNFLTAAFINLKDSLKKGGAFYIWHSAIETFNFWSACNLAELQVRQQLIWVKNIFVIGRQDYHWKHEPCLYGWHEGGSHYFVKDRTQDTIIQDDTIENFNKLKKEEAVELLKNIYSQLEPSSVIFEDKPNKSEIHPTMKPVNLFARLIKNSSKKGESVLDLFGESGTTIIACQQLDRKAYVMEYEPKYADVIIQRWEEFTGEKAELLKK